jgi:hypothetical protein
MKLNRDSLQQALRNSSHTLFNILPIVFGMLLLTSLAISLFPRQLPAALFGGHELLDALLGGTVGSLAAGHPLASYILGGELLDRGVSLVAVTALLVSWVTVGMVQLPAEALLLGRRFALLRNLSNYLFAILIAFAVVYTLRWMGWS